jgi:hypothetical protein
VLKVTRGELQTSTSPYWTRSSIDGAVDFTEPGAAIALPATIDDAEKFQRRL